MFIIMMTSGMAKNSVDATTAVTYPEFLSKDVDCTCVNFQPEPFWSIMDSLFVKIGHL